MPNANTQIKKGQLDPSLRAFPLNFGPIASPANGTYVVALQTSHPFTVDSVTVQTTAGTITCEVRINNVPVVVTGGGSTVAASSSINSKAAISANNAGNGAKITLVLSANAASANLSVTIGCSRA